MPEQQAEVRGKRRAEPKKSGNGDTVRSVRSGLATAVWVLAVLAAVILAVGALVLVLDFNAKNAVVEFFRDTAGALDIFGPFKEFERDKKETQHSVDVKNALVNNAIYAIGYLIVGKVLERVIRP
jgi:hypothetical protein